LLRTSSGSSKFEPNGAARAAEAERKSKESIILSYCTLFLLRSKSGDVQLSSQLLYFASLKSRRREMTGGAWKNEEARWSYEYFESALFGNNGTRLQRNGIVVTNRLFFWRDFQAMLLAFVEIIICKWQMKLSLRNIFRKKSNSLRYRKINFAEIWSLDLLNSCGENDQLIVHFSYAKIG